MIAKIAFWLMMFLLYFWFIHPIFVKPFLDRRKALKKLNKRVRILKEMGMLKDGMEISITNPTLSSDELELLNSEEIPTDEHILLYYKMYCVKHDRDNANTWTTLTPMTFDDWEKRAKTLTKRVYPKKDSEFGFQISGGYQFIIPSTCDTMIGIPPMQTYHRYTNYEKIVKEEEAKWMEEMIEGGENA